MLIEHEIKIYHNAGWLLIKHRVKMFLKYFDWSNVLTGVETLK